MVANPSRDFQVFHNHRIDRKLLGTNGTDMELNFQMQMSLLELAMAVDQTHAELVVMWNEFHLKHRCINCRLTLG